MKKALFKDTVKEIKNTYKRFISILLMAFLGVGFFAGIKATSPDMTHNLDNYFKNQNVYDIQILSTLGLTDEDIEELKKIENVEEVYGTYSKDVQINIENTEIIAKILCLEEVNKPILIDGRLPQNNTECVVEPYFLTRMQKKIGDQIEIQIESTKNENQEEKEYLKEKNVTIVGTIESPLYISIERGTSKLGAGKINYYIGIPKDNINEQDIYTEIYIKVKDSNKYITSSKKYEDYIESVKDEIEKIKEEREKSRYDYLVSTATKKVEDAEIELNDEKEKAQNEIKKAESEIQNAQNEIKLQEENLNASKAKADKEFLSAEKQINNSKQEVTKNENELNEKKKDAEKQFAEAETKKQELQANLESIKLGLEEVR